MLAVKVKSIDGNVVCTVRKGGVNIGLEILKSLGRQGKNEVHGDCFKLNSRQCLRYGGSVHGAASQHGLILFLKGLDSDADFGDACILQRLQDGDRHIAGVQLHTDPLGDVKIQSQCVDNLLQPACGQSRSSAAEVQAGDALSLLQLPSDKMNLSEQRIEIPVAQVFGIEDLAIGTEAANTFAEGDVHIQTRIFTIHQRQLLVIFVFEKEGPHTPGQPHSC